MGQYNSSCYVSDAFVWLQLRCIKYWAVFSLRTCVTPLSNILLSHCISPSRSQGLPISHKIRNYHRLDILMRTVNDSFTYFLLSVILLCWIPCTMASINGFAAIRFRPVLTLFQYFPFLGLFHNGMWMIAIVLRPCAGVYEESKRLKAALTRQTCQGFDSQSKFFRKQVKALKPFGVRYGSVRVAKRIDILLSYSFIADYIFTLLLTFPAEAVAAGK